MKITRWDFSNQSTAQLAADTLRRSRDVHAINNAAWDAMGKAWLASVVGILVGGIAGGVLAAREHNVGLFFACMVVGVVAIGGYWIHEWWWALKDCEEFTAECEARTAELNRRKEARRR